jgi:hypothetical protein
MSYLTRGLQPQGRTSWDRSYQPRECAPRTNATKTAGNTQHANVAELASNAGFLLVEAASSNLVSRSNIFVT